jgi:hypothetical protein
MIPLLSAKDTERWIMKPWDFGVITFQADFTMQGSGIFSAYALHL